MEAVNGMPEPVWNEDLVCNWFGLRVFDPRHVVLLIKPHNSTDMTGAIKVAKAVMPDVDLVTVAIPGTGEIDVIYRLVGEKWEAANPSHGAVLKEAQSGW